MGLRLRLILVLLIPLVLVIGVYGYVRVRQEARELLDNNRRGIGLAATALQIAVENAWRDGQFTDITRILAEVVASQDEIDRIRVFNRNFQPLFVSNRLRIGDGDEVPTHMLVRVMNLGGAEGVYHDAGAAPVLYYFVPVRGNAGEPPQAVLEVVQIASAVQDRVWAAQRDVLARLGMLTLSVAALAGIMLQRQVLHPLGRLMEGIRRLGAGQSGARLPVERNDELGRVAAAFNEMATRLQAAQRDLVAETERTLELEDDVRRMETLAVAGRLATGFAHEVGTPLNIISGRAEYLLDRLPPDDPSRHDLSAIVAQIDRISGIIAGLLDTVRPQKPDLAAVQLSEVFDRIVPLMAHAARRRDVALEADTVAELPPLLADTNQVQQVLINLILNAIEASPAGGRVEVTARGEARDGRPGVTIAVTDTGPGVPAELRTAVFTPFFTTKPRGEGTGLGLAICRDIVRDHGGTIEVADHAGGASFVVWLPAVETDA
ncbi:MAG TPA: ATP-binding protein [Candidatus Limnocylindria bacterium]|nr:ATP-binding protein [Candidatus Limnocylindria bacterium]